MTSIFPPHDIAHAFAVDALHCQRRAIVSNALRGDCIADMAMRLAAEPDLEPLGADIIEDTIWTWLLRTQMTEAAEQHAYSAADDLVPVSGGDAGYREAVPARHIIETIIGQPWDEVPVWVAAHVAEVWLRAYLDRAEELVERQRRRVARAHLKEVRLWASQHTDGALRDAMKTAACPGTMGDTSRAMNESRRSLPQRSRCANWVGQRSGLLAC